MKDIDIAIYIPDMVTVQQDMVTVQQVFSRNMLLWYYEMREINIATYIPDMVTVQQVFSGKLLLAGWI
jgi:hypothetical protein